MINTQTSLRLLANKGVDMEALIESILKLGNHPDFKRWAEPNVMNPLKLERWMVERVMKAISALKEEYDYLY